MRALAADAKATLAFSTQTECDSYGQDSVGPAEREISAREELEVGTW